jgi:hypothetical protein
LFKGRLRLPSDPGEGIPIDLELEDVFLSLDSEGEGFGEWRLDTVEIKRLFSNQFSMLLDGEEMVFIADDALGFAYDGLSTIEDVQSRLSKRRIFKGRKTPKRREAAGEDDLPDEDETEEPDRSAVVPAEPMPEVVPFFPEPSPPSFAEAVADSSRIDESIAPVAPRQIEVADSTTPPPPPVAPVEPPAASRPAETPQPEPQSEPQSEPAPVPPAATAATPLSFGADDDEDLVIEDVDAYGYVPAVATPTPAATSSPEPAIPADDGEIEVEEVHVEEAAAATGAILREVHPLGEPEATPARPATPPDVPRPRDRAEPPAPAADVQAPPMQPTPVEETPSVPSETPPAPPSVPLPPDDQPSFAQWSSNGRAKDRQLEEVFEEHESDAVPATDHQPEEAAAQTQKPGRHARSSGKSKSSVFGRKKSREPEAHEHRYESSKTVGGITRRVCAVCGHVSFAGEDVYQDW